MGRKVKNIKQNAELRVRIEPSLKEKYFNYCKKNNLNLSNEIRQFITKSIYEK